MARSPRGVRLRSACAILVLGAVLGLILTPGPAPVARVDGAGALAALFADLDYRLEPVHAGTGAVPRVFLAALPPDLGALSRIDERKALFVKLVLPLVLEVNEAVLAERRRLERLAQDAVRGIAPRGADGRWLEEIARRYRADAGDLDTLLRRVDVVPPALALAQAALESGWGTSRFATEGQALFGQRAASADGMVPGGRSTGVRVARFDDLRAGIRAYIDNLNSHWAYRDFRLHRAALRRAGGEPAGEALAGGLLRYSERGEAYVRELRRIIRGNRLAPLDRARLVDGGDGLVVLAGT